MTPPRILLTKGGSEFEGYPLPSSRLGDVFSRCEPAFSSATQSERYTSRGLLPPSFIFYLHVYMLIYMLRYLFRCLFIWFTRQADRAAGKAPGARLLLDRRAADNFVVRMYSGIHTPRGLI